MATSLARKKLTLNNPRLIRFLTLQGLCNGGFSSRSLGTLAFEEVRDSSSNDHRPYKSTVFFLHGLLGSGRNWRSFSRNLLSSLSSPSDWRMVLVDLRNHGKSADVEGLPPPHDLNNAAKDLGNLIKSHGWAWPDVVIGHSFGGKVSLEYTESCTRGDYGDSALLPKQLWVLDSVPGEVNSDYGDGEVRSVLQTLKNLPPTFPSRKWLVNYMIERGFSKSFSEWISSNLKKSGDEMILAFDLDIAIEMFNSYCDKSYWSLLENPPKGMEIELVRAENSTRWDSSAIQRLESITARERSGSEGKVEVHVLPNAGHWVHVDNPKGLLEIVAPKINTL